MGAGGVIVPPKGYFEKIQAVCKKYDMLFIADEVICGFGRTGNVWGSQTMNIKPDILTCAKALSASFLPISAVMMNEKVYQALMSESDKIGTWGHGFTYSGHPVAAAVALEAQKIYDETDLFGHAKRMSPIFTKHVQSFADHPLVGEAMSVGLMGALEIVADKKTKASFDLVAVGGRPARLQPRRGARPVRPQHGRPRRHLPAAGHQRDRTRRPVRPAAPVVRRDAGRPQVGRPVQGLTVSAGPPFGTGQRIRSRVDLGGVPVHRRMPPAVVGLGIATATDDQANVAMPLALFFWVLGFLFALWAAVPTLRYWEALPGQIRWLGALPLLSVSLFMSLALVVPLVR